MDLPETKSDVSSTDESQEEKIKDLPTEEVVPDILRPDYSPVDLGQLVCYVRDMVVLNGLRDSDWNNECLTVIEKWFLENHRPFLIVYYSMDRVLTASICMPLTPFEDATYFIRNPSEIIYQVDTFHNFIQYGNIQDPDESLVILMETIFAPYFFEKASNWSERVRVNFLDALDDFLINVTDLHYKISGLTVLPVPCLKEDIDMEDEFTLRRLEKLIIHWMKQIRTFIGDNESKELICPSDDYDFWLYRDEVLHALILQFDQYDVQKVLRILEAKQSIYIKQFNELVLDCISEKTRAAENMRFLSLLIDPCKQLEECKSPSDIPPLLPELIRLILFIQKKSKFLNEPSVIGRLFRALTNHIILYCRSKINIPDVLDGFPREGIKLCSMSIDCCLAYRTIYEAISEIDPEATINLDPLVIFNPIDTFIERLHDMILICEYSEINSMEAPTFGGTWGKEFEMTCQEMARIFNDALMEIKLNKDLALDVTEDRWSTSVITKFKATLKELHSIIQNMIKTAFLYCRNIDDRVEILCSLINYSKKGPSSPTPSLSLTECFNEYVQQLFQSIMDEVAAIKALVLEERIKKRKYSLCEKYSGFGFFLQANLKRAKRLSSTVNNLSWLERDIPDSLLLELKTLEKILEQDIQSNFEEWKVNIPDNMINCLQRSLLIRSLSRPGLLECNIDRSIVILLREATAFKRLQFATPINITQLFQKTTQINFIFENVLTMCIDYNRLVTSLTDKERLLFRPLIKTCDKKITAGIYKLNFAGELGDNFVAECLQLTSQIQEFMTSYKVTNKRIVELCEQICSQVIMVLATDELSELSAIEDQLMKVRSRGCEILMNVYREIVEQIIAVHDGFAAYRETTTGTMADENEEWCEYVRKIDKLLEKAFCRCAQFNLRGILHQMRGSNSLQILPFVRVQVQLEDDQHALLFQPEIATVSSFFAGLFGRLLAAFKFFQRLQTHLRIPKHQQQGKTKSMTTTDASFYDVLKADEKCQEYQRLILKEVRETELAVAAYANTWEPFASQWSVDKHAFMQQFDLTEPEPESFHRNIGKYAEIANQISMQNDDDSRLAIHCIQLQVTGLKCRVIQHIDEWQRLHMDLLAKRSFKKLDLIYEYIRRSMRIHQLQPTSRETMAQAVVLLEKIQGETPCVEEKFKEARNHFRVMDIHDIEVPVEYEKKLKNLDAEWEAFLEKLKEAAETLQTSKDQFG